MPATLYQHYAAHLHSHCQYVIIQQSLIKLKNMIISLSFPYLRQICQWTCTTTLTEQIWNYYNYNHFTTLCPGLPRWVSTRINHSGFCWSRHDGAAVAAAEAYASYLHFAPEDNHASTSSVRLLRAGCPSWHPTNSVKALEANRYRTIIIIIINVISRNSCLYILSDGVKELA